VKGQTSRISAGFDTAAFPGESGCPAISADGTTVAFEFKDQAIYLNRSEVIQQPDKRPVIFIPGIGGSRLFDLTDKVERWPGVSPLATKDQLTLYPPPNQRHKIIATDVFRTGIYLLNIYGPLLDRLVAEGYVEYQVGSGSDRRQANCSASDRQGQQPTLFVFAYDWRQPNAHSAALLHDYIDCVRKFYPDTDVDLIAHSMGGLVARRMILDFRDQHHIHQLITIGTPWLGAPKTTYILETGDFAPIVTDSTAKTIVGSFTGAHELFPGPAYYTLSTAANILAQVSLFPAPFREDGLDVNNNLNDQESYTRSMLRDMTNQRYGYSDTNPGTPNQNIRYLPGSAGEYFHTYNTATGAQDDWRGDATGVQYIHIVGEQAINDTIGQVRATTYKSCSPDSPDSEDPSCPDLPLFVPTYVAGDGTVPDISATRIGGNLNMNAPTAKVYRCTSTDWVSDIFSFSHNALNSNSQVLQMLADMLAGRTGTNWCPLVTGATARSSALVSSRGIRGGEPTATATAHGRIIQLINATNIHISDDGATVYQIGKDSIATALPLDLMYTITFQTNGKPLALSLTAMTQATRYVDIPLPADRTLQLGVAADGMIELRIDVDGNGSYEQIIAPTHQITGAAAADTDGPMIEGVFNRTAAGVEIDVVTSDPHGVARTLVSTDGIRYHPYIASLVVPDETTAISVLADDTLGNRSARRLQMAKSRLMLPLIRR